MDEYFNLVLLSYNDTQTRKGNTDLCKFEVPTSKLMSNPSSDINRLKP